MGNILEVPYIKQPAKSPKCGAACAAMVIKYFKNTNVAIDDIWQEVTNLSPELRRYYCATYKIGAYLSNHHFDCVTVRYTLLKEILNFCNEKGIAPILNHKSFENDVNGHFSVVKNISGNKVNINDPENRTRTTVSVKMLEFMAKKNGPKDEVGGNTLIVPIGKYDEGIVKKYRPCPNCHKDINITFTIEANSIYRLVDQDLCQNCDVFSKSI